MCEDVRGLEHYKKGQLQSIKSSEGEADEDVYMILCLTIDLIDWLIDTVFYWKPGRLKGLLSGCRMHEARKLLKPLYHDHRANPHIHRPRATYCLSNMLLKQCCWWMCGFAWWLWFPSKNHHWNTVDTVSCCNRRNFRTRFNFVFFVHLAESTKCCCFRKPCTYTRYVTTPLQYENL